MSAAQAIAAPKPRRAKTGLALLLLALFISVGAFAFAGLGLNGKVPPQMTTYGIVLVVAFVGAWLVVRKVARSADPVLLPVAAILGGLGVAMLYRIMVDRGRAADLDRSGDLAPGGPGGVRADVAAGPRRPPTGRLHVHDRPRSA